MMKIRTAMLLICLLCACITGCASSGRDILAASQPWHGKLFQKHPDGRVLQVTAWDHGKLVSCWEFSRTHWVDGKSHVSAPQWMQTVSDGTGRRTLYDERGEAAGHEDFNNGDFTGGAG